MATDRSAIGARRGVGRLRCRFHTFLCAGVVLVTLIVVLAHAASLAGTLSVWRGTISNVAAGQGTLHQVWMDSGMCRVVRTTGWVDPQIANRQLSACFVSRSGQFRLATHREGPSVCYAYRGPAPVVRTLTFPLWPMTTLSLVTCTVIIATKVRTAVRNARRERHGSCQACGYDLEGLVAGSDGAICPECGNARVVSAELPNAV